MSKTTKWEFLIPDIEQLLKQTETTKAEIARILIDKYELDVDPESLRKTISRLINDGYIVLSSEDSQVDIVNNVLEDLKQSGYQPTLKSLWKGPTKDTPGFSFEMNEEAAKDEKLEELKKSILEYSPKVHYDKLEEYQAANDRELLPATCAVINFI